MAVFFYIGMQGISPKNKYIDQHDTIDTTKARTCGHPPALCKNIRVQYHGNFGYYHRKKCWLA